ncbi:BCR family protein [Anoxybacter fermentans]|uniref:BCR family protein n=1 Tax=Anoxybacter fermentans TaxID=1323375 RepID=A0A3Q9HP43_9FIRM|nr:metal-sensitive transcriptional regulator [Anoxybacter fermentans]AZR72230.1 BCR family protein [Anoxybacter fermentans]
MSSYTENKDDLLKRLRRIEGQVRGIQRMIEEDQYCVDVLVQIAAVRAALYKVGFNILQNHAHGCVMKAIRAEEEAGDQAIDELLDVIFRFTK